MTPLHLAAESGHIKKMDYLFEKGADINIQDDEGVILNAGRWSDWVWIGLNLRQLAYCCLHNKSLIQALSHGIALFLF